MRALVLASMLAACAHAPRPATPPRRSPVSAPELPGSLAGRLRELRESLAAQGIAYQGVASSGFIAHQGRAVTPFEVPAGRCLTVYAIATAGVHDLDAQLFDPDGAMIVEDVETDAHPTVQLCATEARRVFHLVTAYEGSGAFAVASFVSSREGLETIARAVGGRPGVEGASGAAGSELERRIHTLRDGIARRGFQPTGEPARFALSAGGRVRAAFNVTADRCFTFGAFADGGLSDANLSVIDPSGEVIARDLRGERDALAQLCPRYATTLSVEVAGAGGEGTVVVQAWSADAAAIGGAGALWLGERLGWRGSATSLEQTVARGRARAEALGLRPSAVAPERLQLASGDVQERAVAAPAQGCVGYLASAGRGAGRVDASLYASDGALVARGEAGEGGTLVVTCAPSQTQRSLRVSLEAGDGTVEVQRLEGLSPEGLDGLSAPTVAEAWAARWAHPAERWTARGQPQRVRVGGGARPLLTFERRGGRCARAALISAATELTLDARAPSGARAARVVGEGRAALERCGPQDERLQVELAAQGAAVDGLWMVWDAPSASAVSP